MKKSFSTYIGLALLGILVGCASKLTPVKISSSANTTEEISTQSQLIEAGYANQVDVLSPNNFNEAREYFSQAKELNQKGASADDVFVALGSSKAYMNAANKEALKSTGRVEEVTKARQQALMVGARNFPDQMKPLDNDLAKMSAASSDKINAEEKVALQTKYIALELFCIKHNKLGAVKKILKNAEEKNAEKITPKAYAEALSKFNIADKLIETDRHSNTPIDAAVNVATVSATRVMTLLASEQNSRNQSPEQRAVALEARDNAVKTANSKTFAVQVDSLHKDVALAEKDLAMEDQNKVIIAQGATIAVSEDENMALKKKELDEKIISDAAAKFTPTEAEVFRQNGVLIIRLKSMNFASGRSDLPSDSMNVLAKVKNIILELGAGDVMVEGHTDSVGQAKSR